MQVTVENATPKVLLTLDDRAIAAKYFSLLNDHIETDLVVGIAARRTDGENEFYACENPNPTMRDYYGIHISDQSSYDEKKLAVLLATEWQYDDEYQWLQCDDNGKPLQETDTNETITKWLHSRLSEADDIEQYMQWITCNVPDQYWPGFEILRALDAEALTSLGMHEADRGGPASQVPCVVTLASIEMLNSALATKGLPFVFVDDAGSEEM